MKIAVLPCFTSVFGDRTSFRAKGLRPGAIEPNFVRKGCDRTREIATLLQFLAIEPRFVRKGCARTSANENRSFTMFYLSFWRSNLISCERVAFRAVSLALPRAFKREIEKKESKRAREQESKRARENVTM